MPVTHSFNEKKDQRSSRLVQGSRTYTRVYQDEVSDRVSEADVLAYVQSTAGGAPGIVLGMAHPDPSGAGTVVSEISCEDEAADGRSWKVTVTWATPQYGELSADPLSRPVEYEWTTETSQEEFFRDHSPTPKEVVNSAGMPFDSNPVRDAGTVMLTMVRNETPDFFKTTVLALMGLYAFISNKYDFTVDGVRIAKYRAKLSIRTAAKTIEGGVTYYRTTYIFQFRNGIPGYEADGWRERYLDRGLYAIDGDLKPILDDTGQRVQTPYPLDGAGHAAATPTTAPALVGPYVPYPEFDFAPLRLT